MSKPDKKLSKQQKNGFTATIKEIVQTSISIRNRNIRLDKNLYSILEEEYTFTDKNGVKRTVTGKKTSDEAKAKGTYGVLEVFGTPEYYGHPFEEVSRNMQNHFKLYCLVNGISDQEMLSISNGDIAPELHDKLIDKKKSFFDMVANKDMDAIENYYVAIAEYTEKMLPQLMQCDDIRNIPQNEDRFLLFTGTSSYLQQTLRLNGYTNNTEDQTRLIANINAKLKARQKDYTLNDVEKTLFPFDNFACSLVSNAYDNINIGTDFDFDYLIKEYLDDDDDATIEARREKNAHNSVSENAVKLGMEVAAMKKKHLSKGQDCYSVFSDIDTVYDLVTKKDMEPEELFMENIDILTFKKEKSIRDELTKLFTEVAANSKNTLLKNLNKTDKKALASFIAAKEYIKNPTQFKGIKDLKAAVESINVNAALEAYSNLSADEKRAMLNSASNDNAYVDFIDDYKYNIQISKRENRLFNIDPEADDDNALEAEAREEKRAYAKYSAKETYVNYQKELGKLLVEHESNFSKSFRVCLSEMIAAKQTEEFISKNFDDLTEEQIQKLTSKEAIDARAAKIAKAESFSDQVVDIMRSETIIKLAIGAEPIFNRNAEPGKVMTSASENAIAEVTAKFNEKEKSIKPITMDDVKTLKKDDSVLKI